KSLLGDAAGPVIGLGLLAAYVGLLWVGSRQPELPIDDPNSPVFELPDTGPTVKSGMHYLLAVVVLVWCLMVEQLSPALSAFWATVFMMFVMVTQKPLLGLLRGDHRIAAHFRAGLADLVDGLATGARKIGRAHV